MLGYAEEFLNPENDPNISVEGKRWNDLTHDRWLSIKSNNGYSLIIKPDGGFARGWAIDKDTAIANGRKYTVQNCQIETEVPIYSRPKDGRYVYYIIYKRPKNSEA